MITLKTTTPFSIPFNRGVRNEYVYLHIERLDIDKNNVTPIGYYYFISIVDEVEVVNKLNDITKNPVLWDNIEPAEYAVLDGLESSIHLKDNLLQRLTEFTLIQLEIEGLSNYNIPHTSWEVI